MSDDEGITRSERLRKLAKDAPKYAKSWVEGQREKTNLATQADAEEASNTGERKARGNPMRAVGAMRYIR